MSKPKEDAAAMNLPVSIEEEMRKELAALKDRTGALPANVIRTDNKKFELPDGQRGSELVVIVLDHIWSLVHYKGKWNPNQPQSPDCWALGRDKPESGLLVPHPDVPKPYSDSCATCAKNAWGSGENNAKACRNQRRLLVVGAGDISPKSTILTLYVKPASLRNWDTYITQLANIHKINPIQAVTKVTFDPDSSFNKLQFEFVERNPHVEIAWNLRQQGQEQLFRSIEVRKEAA